MKFTVFLFVFLMSCGSQVNNSVKEEEEKVSEYEWDRIEYLQRYDRFENSEVICYGNIRAINCRWK